MKRNDHTKLLFKGIAHQGPGVETICVTMKRMILIIIVVFVVTCDCVALHSVTCDPDMFYDPVVGRCDFCRVICDNAHIQGTLKECLGKCPGFLSTTATITERDTSTATTSITSTLRPCDAERRTVTVLLLLLCIVSCLLVGLLACVVMTTVKRSRFSMHSQRHVHRSTQPPLLDENHNQT